MFDCQLSVIVIVNYIIFINLCIYCSGELKEGASCLTKDGFAGSCTPLLNCEYATQLIDENEFPKFCNSDYKENFNSLVCCINSDEVGNVKSDLRINESPERISSQMCNKYYTDLYKPRISSRISNGRKSRAKEFPHMAAIGVLSNFNIKWICGGSLISEKFIVTAAHCVERSVIKQSILRVRLGELDTSRDDTDTQDFKVIKVVTHPKYELYYNDIALLELDRPVMFTEYVKPACLYQVYDISAIQSAISTGWGQTYLAGPSSNHLMKGLFRIVDNARCNYIYSTFASEQPRQGIIDSLHICAGGENRNGHCKGDSGGPFQIGIRNLKDFVTQYHIIGVASFGFPCGSLDRPSVFTRIYPYLDWIEKNVWSR